MTQHLFSFIVVAFKAEMDMSCVFAHLYERLCYIRSTVNRSSWQDLFKVLDNKLSCVSYMKRLC